MGNFRVINADSFYIEVGDLFIDCLPAKEKTFVFQGHVIFEDRMWIDEGFKLEACASVEVKWCKYRQRYIKTIAYYYDDYQDPLSAELSRDFMHQVFKIRKTYTRTFSSKIFKRMVQEGYTIDDLFTEKDSDRHTQKAFTFLDPYIENLTNRFLFLQENQNLLKAAA